MGSQAAAQAQADAKSKALAKKEEEAKAKKKKKGGFFGKKKDEDEPDNPEEIIDADLYHSPRPAFYAHTKPTRRNQIPRDVAVPYFRFRKERFYDWPPDPTVSRATPLLVSFDRDEYTEASMHGGRQDGMRRRRRHHDDEIEEEYEEEYEE